MTKKNSKSIVFDYSHNNTLTLESPSYADFTEYLFGSSFALGKIQAGFTSIDKLKKYKMCVIGGPRESFFQPNEIDVIVNYVKNGGSLLVINDEGGDYGANINLNDLTRAFGFEFISDIMFDSMNFVNRQNRVIINEFEHHPITRNIDSIVQSSACSIKLLDYIEADENIKAIPICKSSLNSFHTIWNGEEWLEEEDAPRSIMSLALNYYKGRVIALTTISMFSSLSSTYGFFALNNQDLIANIFMWLLETTNTNKGTKLINISLDYNLFSWIEKIIHKEKKWRTSDELINFSLKYLKDNFEDVMERIEENRQNLRMEREKQNGEIQETTENANYERERDYYPLETGVDSAKHLQEIMNSLAEVTKGEVGKDFNIKDLEIKHDKGNKKVATIEKTEEKKSEEKNEKESSEKHEIEDHKIISRKINARKKNPLKSKADKVIDDALKSLGSFEEFSKKLEEFKSLSDDDEPVA
ncbi:MAG: Gldg family protein [Promethearchaeota archaeon]